MRVTIACTSCSASEPAPTPTEPLTPVGARYSPNTSRSAPAHSPVVTPARAHSSVAAIRFVSVPASATSRASADAARSLRSGSASRSSRHRRTAAAAAASTPASTLWIAVSRSAVSGFGSVVAKRLTPTTTSSPDSIRCRRSECDATSSLFM